GALRVRGSAVAGRSVPRDPRVRGGRSAHQGAGRGYWGAPMTDAADPSSAEARVDRAPGERSSGARSSRRELSDLARVPTAGTETHPRGGGGRGDFDLTCLRALEVCAEGTA